LRDVAGGSSSPPERSSYREFYRQDGSLRPFGGPAPPPRERYRARHSRPASHAVATTGRRVQAGGPLYFVTKKALAAATLDSKESRSTKRRRPSQRRSPKLATRVSRPSSRGSKTPSRASARTTCGRKSSAQPRPTRAHTHPSPGEARTRRRGEEHRPEDDVTARPRQRQRRRRGRRRPSRLRHPPRSERRRACSHAAAESLTSISLQECS
jgi:hypothetical protein